MNIIYKRILNLTVGHSYFKDGSDRFVKIYSSSATEQLLKNGKMLFKRLPNGITILYKTLDDETTPFVKLENDQHFIFILKTANKSGLLNITDLDESLSRPFGTGKIVYYTNNPVNASSNKNNPEILSHEIIDSLRGPLFTYQFSIDGNPSTVKIIVSNSEGTAISVGKDTDGNPIPETVTLSISSNNLFEQQIDLRDYSRGRYQIIIKNADESLTLKSEEIYVDEQLEKENILGIVDLFYESVSNNLYGDTEEYKIQLNRTDTFWKYYIVNKSRNIDFSTDSLSIVDAGLLNGSPYLINDFARVFASIEIKAKTSGSSGNAITLGYSGGGIFPSVLLSGETLTAGTDGAQALGAITIVNNDSTGYTINIGGINFTEGTDFTKGTTPSETAGNLISAINGNGSVSVTAAALGYDMLVNDLETLVFSSKQQIPFFETPKLKIELRKVSDSQTIVANLPNPSHSGIKKLFEDRFESEVYVFI